MVHVVFEKWLDLSKALVTFQSLAGLLVYESAFKLEPYIVLHKSMSLLTFKTFNFNLINPWEEVFKTLLRAMNK